MLQNECEKISFWNLLEKYKITIPRIQRDYAQGRENDEAKEIRDNLLDDLYKTIIEKKEELELDFIYGRIIVNEDNENEIQLLDGQQRITTLFLIYWYIGKRTNEIEEMHIKDILKKFSYNNRKNAAEFCENLVNNSADININDLINNKEYKKRELCSQIENKLWFLIDWKNEPTIVGMLNMLEEIHKKFRNCKIEENIFKRMTDNNIITMYLLDTRKYNLSDELYIKMNSRGKELSEYDRVKEKMIRLIKKININLLSEFNKKIETKWNEFFFDYYNKKIHLDNLDDSLESLDNKEFLNLFYYITEMIYICKVASNDEINSNKNNKSPFLDTKKRFKYIERTYINFENLRLLFDILNLMQSKEKVREYMQVYTQMPMFFIEKNKYNVIDRIIEGNDEIGIAEKEITFFYLVRLTNKINNNIEFIRMIRNLIQKNRYFSGSEKRYALNPRYYGIKKDYEILKKVIASEDCYKELNSVNLDEIEGFSNFSRENILDESRKYKYIDNDKVKYIENLDTLKGNIKNFEFLLNQSMEDIKKFHDTIKNNIIVTYMNMLQYTTDWIRNEPKYTYFGDKYDLYNTFTNDRITRNIFETFYNNLKENNFDIFKLEIHNKYKEDEIYYYFIKYPEFWQNIYSNNILCFRKYNEIKINWYRSSRSYGKHINVFLNTVAIRNNYQIIDAIETNESGIVKIDDLNSFEIDFNTENKGENELILHMTEKTKKIKIDLNNDVIEQIENEIKKNIKL